MKKNNVYSFLLSLMIDDDSVYPIIDFLAYEELDINGSGFWQNYYPDESRPELYERITLAFPDADMMWHNILVDASEFMITEKFTQTGYGLLDVWSLMTAATESAEGVIAERFLLEEEAREQLLK